ncbi:MAG TPA: prepilin peptidase [Sedimentisphaerales bacterium]|nr:prepilin peptidase [Sedimentisphaerales bacterium]
MTPQEWIIVVFLFMFGCCIGSFLNVVIYRLPREKSLVHPGSACPRCGKSIRFYDNIPLLSWLLLRARCRYCKAPISPRYFIVELLTGSVFLGVYLAYFHTGIRPTLGDEGSWFIYALHLVLIAAFIAASGIDLELWIIPLSICWFVTVTGLIGSAAGGYLLDPRAVKEYSLLPTASPGTGAMAVGAAIGLGIGWLLLRTGALKRSYEQTEAEGQDVTPSDDHGRPAGPGPFDEPQYNHRLEALREVLFLLPILVGAVLARTILGSSGSIGTWWSGLLAHPVVSGLFGSLFGYFVGCATVWATRVLGTLAFGKEAMGLGDVHLMGAAGAVVGPVMVAIAFFIAPFFGLGWALFQMLSKKIRQIPYGPFLSLAILTVMIFHDWILDRVNFMLSP